MTALNGKNRGKTALSGTIRRQISAPDNRRLLTRLPLFAPQNGPLPAQFASLLNALDRAEDRPIAPENPAKD